MEWPLLKNIREEKQKGHLSLAHAYHSKLLLFLLLLWSSSCVVSVRFVCYISHTSVQQHGSRYESELHCNAECGRTRIVQMLLEAGANTTEWEDKVRMEVAHRHLQDGNNVKLGRVMTLQKQ